MKSIGSAPFLALGTLLLCVVPCTSDATNPISKVLELLASMEQQIIKEGEERQKGYVEFADMCEDRSKEISHEIKTANSQVEELKATIDKAADDEAETTTEIEEISSMMSTAESDLKGATEVRKKEAADFGEDQKDMIETIGQMERAISILEKQLKGGAAFAQLPISVQKDTQAVQKKRAAALAEVFAAIVDSSSLGSADTERLSSLIQASEGDSDSESESDGADLDAADWSTGDSRGNSGSIVETLENVLEKAQAQLESARSKETKTRHNYELFSASLKRKIDVARKDMLDAKKAMGEAGQSRAKATGDLEVTTKDLAEDKKALEELHHECMHKAEDFEEETKARDDELKALGTAKKVIKEMTGGAEEKTYGDFAQVSFVQARSKSSWVPPSVKAVRAVKELGKRLNMPILLDMSHKMESVIRNSAISGEDPFKKVKGMISTMLGHLTKMMEDEASHKAYCDKEMSDTVKSKDTKQSTVDKLSTRIDTQSSDSMSLKEQVAVLQKELLANMETQKEMDRIRQQEHSLYARTKPELEQGQDGIQKALKVLRQYYSQDDDPPAGAAKEGAGTKIIGLLEIVESDFAKGLANLQEEEESSQAQYEKQTHENTLVKTVKNEEVTFKTKEIKALSKATSESSSDLDGVQTELDAVNEYYNKIQEECVAKPEPYEERRKRQAATLQGLQDAEQILGAPAALEQQSSRRLRGVTAHQ